MGPLPSCWFHVRVAELWEGISSLTWQGHSSMGVRVTVRKCLWRLCSWSIPSWSLFMGHHGVNHSTLPHDPSWPNSWDSGKVSPPFQLVSSGIWSQWCYNEHKWCGIIKESPDFLPMAAHHPYISIKGICRWPRDRAEKSWLCGLILLKSDGFFSTHLSPLPTSHFWARAKTQGLSRGKQDSIHHPAPQPLLQSLFVRRT